MRKKCEKSANMTPIEKPVLARNGKSDNVLEEWKHAISRQKIDATKKNLQKRLYKSQHWS